MPISRARSIVRSASAVLVLTFIVAIVPLVLAAAAGWPLPRSVPNLGEVWTRLQQGDVPAESVLKGLAVVSGWSGCSSSGLSDGRSQ